MDVSEVEQLRERHPAWRLLQAKHAPLVLGFLGAHFIEAQRPATSSVDLAVSLGELLEALNLAADPDGDSPPYPRRAVDYLESWASAESGWLRRFYPTDADDAHYDAVHYDATPALEKAYAWVTALPARRFVGTESRLHTVVDLLRQITRGTEADPDERLSELRARRDAIDREIAMVESGVVEVLDDTGVRERYQQLSSTARELLSDFREVEENFRSLDREARSQIASWTGSKGELLTELVASRADIAGSDQGHSFQAFYDFLLSEQRQDELSALLAQVQALPTIEADPRLRRVHHDWSEAAERTQVTVRQLSEQLRRFLDEQVWLENRRVLDLVRSVEASALRLRQEPPALGLDIEAPGVAISLPLERPLYDARPAAEVESILGPSTEDVLDVSALFAQRFVDQARLADNIRAVVPPGRAALLEDVLRERPVEQGVAEIVGYLSLSEDDLDVEVDESEETLVDYDDLAGVRRRARMPRVLVSRR